MILHNPFFSTSVSDNVPNFFTVQCIVTSTKVKVGIGRINFKISFFKAACLEQDVT